MAAASVDEFFVGVAATLLMLLMLFEDTAIMELGSWMVRTRSTWLSLS